MTRKKLVIPSFKNEREEAAQTQARRLLLWGRML
jgi:hypothetical protein